MRKRILGQMQTARAQVSMRIRAVWSASLLSANCPFDTIECINGEQMPGWDFAHAWDESESVHFAHDQRHLFAWLGQDMEINEPVYAAVSENKMHTTTKTRLYNFDPLKSHIIK